MDAKNSSCRLSDRSPWVPMPVPVVVSLLGHTLALTLTVTESSLWLGAMTEMHRCGWQRQRSIPTADRIVRRAHYVLRLAPSTTEQAAVWCDTWCGATRRRPRMRVCVCGTRRLSLILMIQEIEGGKVTTTE